MNLPFEDKYRAEIQLLDDLYGAEVVARSLPRVKEIYEYTEAAWHEYVCSIGKTPIQYLLIAEAPPWSETGTPQYVLDPASKPRTFMAAIRGAFLGARSVSPTECLKVLAAEGFLVLDSTPFAMNYSPKRSSKKYDRLIHSTASSYLQPKIHASNLEWSPNVRVAFAVARNARSILKSIGHLDLGGRRLALSESMIAVNGAGYPDAKKLRQIYGLSQTRIA